LRWLRSQPEISSREKKEIHFFIDSTHAISSLCDPYLPEKHFFLVQDIKHTASSLSDRYNFITHWIPSHIDRLSYNQFSIEGNKLADTLANHGRIMSSNNHPCEKSLNMIRDEIMDETSRLLWKIKELLIPDGPSSDDFSSANANQIISRDNLR